MDQTKSEYEFLDLTDINDEERSSLTSALFSPAPPASSPTKSHEETSWTATHLDLSSCSSDTPGPPTVSSSLDSLPGAARDMAPPPPSPRAQPTPPPPPAQQQQAAYTQPPPALYPPQPHPPPHWPAPLMPPNVYVSQVTANVNVHGYMSQYYQPHQQYVQPEQRGRDGSRRGRRGGINKRAPSPPQTPYIYYPQYYPTAQTAQGAPLYHVPIYPPVGYMAGYPYPSYMEYPMMEDPNRQEKGPEEYPQEMLMEHEHMQHEMYYSMHPGPMPPPAMYDPGRPMEGACLEPYPPFYSIPPPPAPSTHQFNVHAKNFVRQSEHKYYNQPPQQEQHKQEHQHTKNNPPPNSNAIVESVPIKDLKISAHKPPQASPKHVQDKPPVSSPQLQTKSPPVLTNDKVGPKPPTDTPKPVWSANTAKNTEVPPSKPLPPAAPQVIPPTPVVNKPVTPTPNTLIPVKVNKSAPAPFVSIKSFVKGNPSQQPAGVIIPQQSLPSKAPFANKHKKEVTVKPQEPPSVPEAAVEPAPVLAVAVPVQPIVEAKLPAAPVLKPNPPVAIAPAPIVSKAPFSHARKTTNPTVENPPPAPAPPPAPTSSDFPPPPAPRRLAEQTFEPPQSAPNTKTTVRPINEAPPSTKTWASLFGSRVQTQEEPAVNTNTVSSAPLNASPALPPPAVPLVQKPVAKVGPFDASPLQQEIIGEKMTNNVAASGVSYSEKAMNSVGAQGQKNSSPSREEANQRDGSHMFTPVPAHINDPNLYRMGEFLSRYQLNHQTVLLQPRGLSNRSNYCYINSILQALLACPPFYNMLKSLPHQQTGKGKSTTPIIDAMVDLCNEFQPLPPGARITRAERSARSPEVDQPTPANSTATPVAAGPPFEPAGVLKALRDMQHGDSFRVEGRQEDAEEFLGCLLNGLNDEMLELIKLAEPEESKDAPIVANGNDTAQESDDDDDWKVMGPKNKGAVERRCLAGRTPLSDIFRGQLRSRLQRATENNDSTHYYVEPFFTLPLDIERSNSVHEALERVAGRDRLEGVTCPSRGRPVEAWRQSLLERLPSALLLHLKCFHIRQDGATAKIVKNIDYPINLKIDPKIISPKVKYSIKQKTYKLFAVVYHEGAEAEKGHYLADAYHAGYGGWLRYDDSVVTAVTEHQVLHPRLPRTPYLLLYRRQDNMSQQPPPRN